MPEEPTPLGENDIQEALIRQLDDPAIRERLDQYRREYKEYCRSIRKRHRGAAREAMLRYEGGRYQQLVQQLLEEAKGKP